MIKVLFGVEDIEEAGQRGSYKGRAKGYVVNNRIL